MNTKRALGKTLYHPKRPRIEESRSSEDKKPNIPEHNRSSKLLRTKIPTFLKMIKIVIDNMAIPYPDSIEDISLKRETVMISNKRTVQNKSQNINIGVPWAQQRTSDKPVPKTWNAHL
eukprot:13314761-Ditylum_brightwellii.AAC.1